MSEFRIPKRGVRGHIGVQSASDMISLRLPQCQSDDPEDRAFLNKHLIDASSIKVETTPRSTESP